MDGFTGFNPSEVTQQLNQFSSAIDEVFNYEKEAFEKYNYNLVNAWYSPIAHENSKVIFQFSEVGQLLKNLKYTVVRSIVDAMKIEAQSNGMNYDYPIEQSTNGNYNVIDMKESGPSGEVGMNKMAVDAAVSEFDAAVKVMVNTINNLPSHFSVYDPYQAVANEIKNMIGKVSNTANNYFEKSIQTIKGIIEAEENHIDAGVNNATQTLVG